MVAAVVAVIAFALILLILVTAGAMDRAIDRAVKDAFASITEEDLAFDFTVNNYTNYLRTSPDAEAEAQIKSSLKELR